MKLDEIKIGHVYKDTHSSCVKELFYRIIFYDKGRSRLILLAQEGGLAHVIIDGDDVKNMEYIGEEFPSGV